MVVAQQANRSALWMKLSPVALFFPEAGDTRNVRLIRTARSWYDLRRTRAP